MNVENNLVVAAQPDKDITYNENYIKELKRELEDGGNTSVGGDTDQTATEEQND